MPDNLNTAGQTAKAEGSPAPPASPENGAACVVVLVEDAALLDMLGKAVEGRRRLWHADSMVHAADLMMAAPSAILLVDAAVTGKRTAEFVASLTGQFVDLPIIVSGRLDDEVQLGSLISSGAVFRFLHKPVSVERARTFIEAAVRRLDEAPVQRPARDVAERLAVPSLPRFELPRLRLSQRFIRRTTGVAGLLLVLGLLGWAGAALIERAPWKALDLSLPDSPSRPDPGADGIAVQKLVDAAGVALSQGRLVEPEERNAVSLYRAALARDPANAQARRGLTKVADELVHGVEQALLDDNLTKAASLLDAARGVDPTHPRLPFLSAQLAEDSRQVAREAAAQASGRPAEAEALEQRLTALLAVAGQRMKAGRLVGGLDSAEAYVLEARQAAPDDPGVRQALRELSASMLLSARQAWSEGNEPAARNWLQRAHALGVDPEGVARFSAEIASARLATTTEDLSRLLALANQRLAQGRLLLPPTDSARHYLDLLRAADPGFAGVAETEALLGSRLLDEARRLSGVGRHGDAQRYVAAAEAIGARGADLDAAQAAVSGAQAARKVLPESALKRIAGEPPGYPARAAARGVEGWVDVEFTVTTTGVTSDAVVTDASPAGMFDDAVLDAVRRWRYEPYRISGIAVDQRVRLRLRFKLAPG